MGTRHRLGLSAAVAITLLTTACGGSSHPSAASYVHTVCAAMRTFGTKVQAAAAKLPSQGEANASSPKVLRQATSSFLDAAKVDGNEAVTTINRLGTPGITNGAAIQRTILGAFQQLAASYGSDATQVANLDASNGTAFYKQLKKISSSSQQLGSSIDATLQGKDGLGSPALDAARAKDSICASLD